MRSSFVLLLMLGLAPPLCALEGDPTDAERQKLSAEAQQLNQQGVQFFQRSQYTEALQRFEEALALQRKLYPESQYPDGHPDLAEALNNLGAVLNARGAFDTAAPYWEQTLAIRRKLYPESKYPDGHPLLAASLNNVGMLLYSQGASEKAVPYYEQAMAMWRRVYPESKYPDGHSYLALGLINLGSASDALGALAKATSYYEQALAMQEKLYPQSQYPEGHPQLLYSLNNLGTVLREQGEFEKARTHVERCLAMAVRLFPESKYPDGHPHLAGSLITMGGLLKDQGALEKALPYFEKALSMKRKLYPESKYPDGHPTLATGLNNLGFLLEGRGNYAKAASYFEQALEMSRRLYPESKYPSGHPDLVNSLFNMGAVLRRQEALAQARLYQEQALVMARKLYPESKYADGHAFVALCLNYLGFVQQAQGAYADAAASFQQALVMRRKLYPPAKYPDGHPHVAVSLENLGLARLAQGELKNAAPDLHEAAAIRDKFTRREIATASEADALALLRSQPFARDAYLSVALRLPDTEAASYQAVWDSKAALTRILERRHAAARAASAEHDVKLARLRDIRRVMERLLQDPRRKADERDRLLTALADERDLLERELAKSLPILSRWAERDKLAPNDLCAILPRGSVFIDIVAYNHVEFDPKVQGPGGEKRRPSYLAFVLAPGQAVKRIDLGDITPIDKAVRAWRLSIEQREASDTSADLRLRLWERLAKHIPTDTRTLYLSTEGDLARIPWAALPTGADRVLLEDFVIATVPHGSFLLEQLKFPRAYDGPESVLSVGGVDYGKTSWPALPGTAAEISALAPLSPSAPITLSKTEATAAKLAPLLPQMRYAHFATHGEFKADELATEKKREVEARTNWREGLGQESRRTAAKNPLGFIGLVLSDGESLTGLSLVDLPLENLKLVTLSACETGLGEYTGGEGVQGLQRAFHLAGCPNVVASLWKVNDAATAALMVKFYHELWVNKKPPIEALREAQLTIYRRPDLIPVLAAERGIKLEKAIESASTQARADGNSTTPTKLWAAFVLSGVGR